MSFLFVLSILLAQTDFPPFSPEGAGFTFRNGGLVPASPLLFVLAPFAELGLPGGDGGPEPRGDLSLEPCMHSR